MKNQRRNSGRNQATRRNTNNVVTTPAQSLENGLKVLRYAIKNKLSVSAASLELGRGKNYVSAIKNKLTHNRQQRFITNEQSSNFKALYERYENNR